MNKSVYSSVFIVNQLVSFKFSTLTTLLQFILLQHIFCGCVRVSLENTLMEILKLLGYQVCLFLSLLDIDNLLSNDCVNLFSY